MIAAIAEVIGEDGATARQIGATFDREVETAHRRALARELVSEMVERARAVRAGGERDGEDGRAHEALAKQGPCRFQRTVLPRASRDRSKNAVAGPQHF